MSRSVEYLIVQYNANPMRREPKNIGIIVIGEESRAGRFVGEVLDTGVIDGRSTRWMSYPNIYQQWVKYWREQLNKGGSNLPERLSSTNGDEYDVVSGGFITDFGDDHPSVICDHLYPLLVAEPQAAAIKSASDEDRVSADEFSAEVLKAFRERELMFGRSRAPHPILHRTYIRGAHASYQPEFYQINGRPYVMETINFSTRAKGLAKHHAGYVATMFNDVREKNERAEGIAIVRATREDLDDDAVTNSLAMLTGNTIVRWTMEDERRAFLADRERVSASVE